MSHKKKLWYVSLMVKSLFLSIMSVINTENPYTVLYVCTEWIPKVRTPEIQCACMLRNPEWMHLIMVSFQRADFSIREIRCLFSGPRHSAPPRCTFHSPGASLCSFRCPDRPLCMWTPKTTKRITWTPKSPTRSTWTLHCETVDMLNWYQVKVGGCDSFER